ncbi:hypothetical protein C1645_733071 [Glomus cerebriforme]|uniref:F-box domain-containing protein n=1 Tax=Glomus cerebriforme TaxID=658196 RepID=A0A397TP62_9GLOM|nr:hypothetical protein C1645_733071 [Glomus cerebriforme]
MSRLFFESEITLAKLLNLQQFTERIQKSIKRNDLNLIDAYNKVPKLNILSRFPERPSQISKYSYMSPEIFVMICEDLPPSALFSLSKTCIRFHTYLIDYSSSSQNIWKISRKNFFHTSQDYHPNLPLPSGWNEYNYCRFFTSSECQYCETIDNVHIYWTFRVRCCDKCLFTRTILIKEVHLHSMPFLGLPYIRYKRNIPFKEFGIYYRIDQRHPFGLFLEDEITNRLKEIKEKGVDEVLNELTDWKYDHKLHVENFKYLESKKESKNYLHVITKDIKDIDINIVKTFTSWHRAMYMIYENDKKNINWNSIENEMKLEAEIFRRRKFVYESIVKMYPRIGSNSISNLEENLKCARVDPLTILMQCPSYRNPLLIDNNFGNILDEKFFNKFLSQLEDEVKKLNLFPKGNIITISTALLMKIDEPIFKCEIPSCKQEEDIWYTPKLMKNHLNSLHETLFIIPEKEKVSVDMNKIVASMKKPLEEEML